MKNDNSKYFYTMQILNLNQNTTSCEVVSSFKFKNELPQQNLLVPILGIFRGERKKNLLLPSSDNLEKNH
jgi:hypothetical protein